MKYFRSTIAAIILMICSVSAFSQTDLFKADKLFCRLYFEEAKQVYLDIVKEDKKVLPDVYFKLAECYRLLDKPIDASAWYAISVTYSENSPIDYLLYAQSLQQLGNVEEARKWYSEYEIAAASDSRGARGVIACENIPSILQNPEQFAIRNESLVNTPTSDITPTFFKEVVIFSSDRESGDFTKKEQGWTGNPYYNLYVAEIGEDGNLISADIIPKNINSKYHDGPPTQSQDHNLMIYTKSHSKKKKTDDNCPRKVLYNLKLVEAKYDATLNAWAPSDDKAFQKINNVNYNAAHPTLAVDGKTLYFISDNPDFEGHLGGTDIYVSTSNGITWSEPKNLGPNVNTEGNESFPYISNDNTLYYSSDANPGNGGLGGLDIYFVKYDSSANEFKNVANMGAPINSKRDDFGIIVEMRDNEVHSGYFTSSRTKEEYKNAQGGDDIYYFFPNLPFYLEVLALDDCERDSLPGVEISVMKDTAVLIQDLTDTNGIFLAETGFKMDSSYTIRARYLDQEITRDLLVSGYKLGDTINLDYLFEGGLKVYGNVMNDFTNQPLVQATVIITDIETDSVITVETDDKGYYAVDLKPDKTYNIDITKFGYKMQSETFSTADMDCQTIQKMILIPPGSLFLLNVYYYFDKAKVERYAEDLTELNKLVTYLKENPTYIIEIRSHTDARASFKYNEGLGKRRAQSVKDYLIAQGITEERLFPISYGEYCIINQCVDGVRCNEVQHQRNRRTQVYVMNSEKKTVITTREQEKWTIEDDQYVEGGKYYEKGKGSNWKTNEGFEGKTSNWRNIPVRKKCADDSISETDTEN